MRRDIEDYVLKIRKSEYSFFKKRAGDVALLIPYPYPQAIGSLSWQAVYKKFADYGVRIERFFFPPFSNFKLSELRSVETLRPLGDFELVLVSSIWEKDFVEIVKRCDIKAKILAGGKGVEVVPNLWASEFDGVLLGRVEALLDEYGTDIFRKYGIVKSSSDKVEFFYSIFFSSWSVFKDAVLLELSKSCPRRCPFCVVPETAGRFAYVEFENFKEIVLRLRKFKDIGAKKLGIITTALTDVPRVLDYLEFAKTYFDLTASSFTVGSFKAEVLKYLHQQTVTFGVETTVEAKRKEVGKYFSDAKLLEVVRACRGMDKIVKIYLLWEEDWEAGFFEKLKPFIGKKGIEFSINPVVVKFGVKKIEEIKRLLANFPLPNWKKIERYRRYLISLGFDADVLNKKDWYTEVVASLVDKGYLDKKVLFVKGKRLEKIVDNTLKEVVEEILNRS